MSLQPDPVGPVPDDTARIARASFPKGNPYLRLRDDFGLFYTDERFATLFPRRGQPAEAPWRVASSPLQVKLIAKCAEVQAAGSSPAKEGMTTSSRSFKAVTTTCCPAWVR